MPSKQTCCNDKSTALPELNQISGAEPSQKAASARTSITPVPKQLNDQSRSRALGAARNLAFASTSLGFVMKDL
ncbi:hypothetical protein GWI33_000401 [Rhynchophorus ferrugineus]|uniref:Uncharacterized protein n=1 Tax=Rhynchophorus ferrugineus TaxID=354439 RepID=A0A834IMW7_RHYFE|nr:hypothetical protein GWI33_000401 [Rhynchophorus ferrugineus]